MFYLKASLIISAVSALPLSDLKARQNSQLVSSELIPGTCSWQCGPTIDVASDCASGDESCICTASAAYELQYCLSCFVTQSSAGSLQPNASSSSMLTAVEWANNFNTQCREAGYDLPAVFVGGSDSASERAVASTDNGSPAVPRVGSPASASTPAPAVPASTSTSSTASQTSSQSSSATPSPSSASSSTPTPTPTSSPAPGSAATSSSSSGASVITFGSQTITIASSATPINIPGSNASDGSTPDAAAAAAANTALRSMADVWLAMMVGTLSVIAAVMF